MEIRFAGIEWEVIRVDGEFVYLRTLQPIGMYRWTNKREFYYIRGYRWLRAQNWSNSDIRKTLEAFLVNKLGPFGDKCIAVYNDTLTRKGVIERTTDMIWIESKHEVDKYSTKVSNPKRWLRDPDTTYGHAAWYSVGDWFTRWTALTDVALPVYPCVCTWMRYL